MSRASSTAVALPVRYRHPAWLRLTVAHLLQMPAVAGVLLTPAAWWPAAFWASFICIIMCDSGWRWRNRLLVAEAVAWLWLAFCLG
jgi:hypothetical protein